MVWGRKSSSGLRGRAPVGGLCQVTKSLEAETLLLNEHAIFNAHLLKILLHTYDIFTEIRTAHFEIPTTQFVLPNTLF